MTAIARDAVAAAQLVYAWPFPLGPDVEIACAEDEHVVMCPAWLVGERLGPGRHVWRTPDPTRPSAAYFVLSAPVEVQFDMTTSFTMPATGQRVRITASGSLQVRCADAQLLIAQFVGLPFDDVNGGVLRSVSRSVERMLARLLIRRVVLAASTSAVNDPQNQPAIIEELVAYNPAAGAVFGIEMIRMGHLTLHADDGTAPVAQVPVARTQTWGRVGPNGNAAERPPVAAAAAPVVPKRNDNALLETVRGRPKTLPPPIPKPAAPAAAASAQSSGPTVSAVSGEIQPRKKTPVMGVPETAAPPPAPAAAPMIARATPAAGFAVPIVSSSMSAAASGEIGAPPPPRQTAGSMKSVSLAADEPTPPPDVPPAPIGQPIRTPPPGSLRATATTMPPVSSSPGINEPPAPRLVAERPSAPIPIPTASGSQATASGEIGGKKDKAKDPDVTSPDGLAAVRARKATLQDASEARGAIMGIGMAAIGDAKEVKGGASVTGEIQRKVAPGQRVLVPGPNGLMQSATVRQLLQGYYELEVGATGQTIWVPMAGVVPEPEGRY